MFFLSVYFGAQLAEVLLCSCTTQTMHVRDIILKQCVLIL